MSEISAVLSAAAQHRPTLAHYVATRDELDGRAQEPFVWLRDNKLSIRIDREFSLKEVSEARRALKSRETTGKILLRPSTL
jgi:NADPH:quinone reductase